MGEPAPLPHKRPTASFWHSEPSSLLTGHRSTRELPSNATTVVIGAGMTGTSVAWQLLRQQSSKQTSEASSGPDVLLMDAREVCWGATGRNGGHCQPLVYTFPSDPDIGRFELLNHATVAALAGTKPPSPAKSPFYPPPLDVSHDSPSFPCEFVTQPGVRAFMNAREAEALEADLQTLSETDQAVAAHCTLVKDKVELARLRCPDAVAAVVTDVAGRMWPYKFVAGVVEHLLLDPEIGDRFNLQTHTPVTKLHRDGNAWLVETERGSVRARNVVLATNAYTSHLMPQWADLVVPCRGQMSALKPSEELQGKHRLATSFGFQGVAQDDYLVQRPNEGGGHMMFGGGAMYGTRIGNADDSTIDQQAATYLKDSLPKFLGLKDKTPLEAVQIWTGVMGFSRDEKPLVGPVPDQDGLYISAGYSGHGMPNTWLCGRAVAEMVSNANEGQNLEVAVAAARKSTSLPESYLITHERLKEMRRGPTVEEQDIAIFSKVGKQHS